jgi:hypothetical protein
MPSGMGVYGPELAGALSKHRVEVQELSSLAAGEVELCDVSLGVANADDRAARQCE